MLCLHGWKVDKSYQNARKEEESWLDMDSIATIIQMQQTR